jgi:single-strand DNA-binding protein
MQTITIAGTTGKDAEFKTTQSGAELCSTSVAVNGFSNGEKTTTWYDVTSWGKGSEGLARVLRKGSKIACVGEFSTQEHNGKTYFQVRTNGVTILGTPDSGKSDQRREPDGSRGHAQAQGHVGDDLSDEIPF